MDNQPVTPPQQPPAQSIQEQQASSNLTWLKTLSIGFSLVSFGIAIGIAGYILATQKNQPSSQNQQVPSPTTSQPSPIPDPTANWKSYSDPNNQFSLKYPPDWSYKLGEPAKTLYFSKPDGNATLAISVTEAVNLDTIVRKLSFNGTVEDIVLDEVSGKTVKFDLTIENRVYKIKDFDFLKNMRRYSLRTSYYPKENSQLDQMLNQILSTFRFD